MRRVTAGGGWPAIWYVLKKSHQAGGLWRMYRALRRPNACKTCALGMGGQRGGMVNEAGRFPEFCKKSIQAMAADLQGRVPATLFSDHDFATLGKLGPRELESGGRLVEPMAAGPLDDRYRPIEWDQALATISTALRKHPPEEMFFYLSGRSSNEAAFLLQLFARLLGTNHVNNCSYYCHQASGVGLSRVTGSGTATVVLEDVEQADVIFLLGANPASNHPRFMRSLMDVRRKGGQVVVINPLRETGLVRFKVPSDVRSLLFGTDIASAYVQPHIGGDIALLNGIAKAVLESGAADEAFLEQHTNGWPALREQLGGLAWEDLQAASGVTRTTMRELAATYARGRRVIFAWAMGLTHHAHGVENVQAVANLALLRGMVGRPGCGLLPLRGHSNVQGVGSMGVTPALKQAVFERLEQHFEVRLPTMAGLDTLGCLEAAEQGRMRVAFCLGGNLYGASPDLDFVRRAFANIDLVVYLSTTLNTGHVWARGRETIILPVRPRDEEDQATTQESMFNFVRLSDGGKARLEGPRAEVDVIASIGEAVLGPDGPVDWTALREHRRIREAIGRIIPGYEAIGEIDRTRDEFHIAGRTFHEPQFATEDGRARLHVIEVPPPTTRAERPLRLMTVRSEGQFNTVVYEEEDAYRGQERRDVILMSADDIAARGLTADQRVTVTSDTGSLSGLLARPFDLPAGNAVMYFPEANILIPRHFDSASRTPAFKNVAVEVSAD